MKRFSVGDMAKVVYTGGHEDCYLGSVCEIMALDVPRPVRRVYRGHPMGDIAVVHYPTFDYEIRMCDGAIKHCQDDCLAPIDDPDKGTADVEDKELEQA